MTLIDTSDDYSGGRSEKLIGDVIAGQRDRVFLVSKLSPSDVTGNRMARACAASLARLGTDHLDLYLLHWPSLSTGFTQVVVGFENLRATGKIRVPGACQTSPSIKWKISSEFHEAIVARPIRSLTASSTVALNMTYYHGANSTACR